MKFVLIVLFSGAFLLTKCQDTLYVKGGAPIIASVLAIDEDDFITIKKVQQGKSPIIEKVQKKGIKAIKYKNGFVEKFKSDKYYYSEIVQLINARSIKCVVIDINEGENIKIDTDNSSGPITIPIESVAYVTYKTGVKEKYGELIGTPVSIDNDSNISAASDKSIDSIEKMKFIEKWKNYTRPDEITRAKGSIEDIKFLFDLVVKAQKDSIEKNDSLTAEIILEYCRLSDEIYFNGEKINGIPAGKGELYKPNGEIQIGEFVNGKLTGYGKVLRNTIIEKEGIFSNGELNGAGTINDGRRTMKGTFIDNQLTGQGSISWQSGAFENGEYLQCRLNGKGERHLQNKNSYKGDFKNGKYDGYGVFNWTQENISFEGYFKDAKRNGEGLLKLPNDISISGIWIDDCADGEIKITTQTNDNRENYALWIIKDCKVESKKNIKGKIKFDEPVLFIKTTGYQ